MAGPRPCSQPHASPKPPTSPAQPAASKWIIQLSAMVSRLLPGSCVSLPHGHHGYLPFGEVAVLCGTAWASS